MPFTTVARRFNAHSVVGAPSTPRVWPPAHESISVAIPRAADGGCGPALRERRAYSFVLFRRSNSSKHSVN